MTYLTCTSTFRGLIVAAMCSFAAPALAAEQPAAMPNAPEADAAPAEKGGRIKDNPDEFCSSLAELAEVIMMSRQKGVPMAAMMKAVVGSGAGGDGGVGDNMVAFSRSAIMDAYNVPRWSSPDNQRAAAQDFRDQATALCYQMMQENGVDVSTTYE